MSRVAVIGCGVIGAAIAYELSQVPGLSVTVFDRQPPAQASTGAALGVLMGVISQKVKGKAWQLRLASLQRYETLIPELEAIAGQPIPFNRQGILKLCLAGEDLSRWQALATVRQTQGYALEILDPVQVQHLYPQIQFPELVGAVYSPSDRQVDPVALTSALVTAAQQRGVEFHFGQAIEVMNCKPVDASLQACWEIATATDRWAVDWVVIAAGLGSTPLTAGLQQAITIRPVLGQALHLHLDKPLAASDRQPVITGNDVHIVPIKDGEYWVGATVEFPVNGEPSPPDSALLDEVLQQAIAFCPALANATVLRTWSGLRPRPENRPAPVIDALPGYQNILLATGHYRNGILLAPATAQAIRERIVSPV